ncbi:MAG TPA: dienelactone hydrolase family protein, partial [Thermoanaerobaculia bacterium]|nr:dienelactone hydrolase family protein [Thermoanaerobaculia bacterium]
MDRYARSLALVVFLLPYVARAQSAGKIVSYPSGSETVSGYLATQGGSGKRPAIVVIHDWYGL